MNKKRIEFLKKVYDTTFDPSLKYLIECLNEIERLKKQIGTLKRTNARFRTLWLNGINKKMERFQ